MSISKSIQLKALFLEALVIPDYQRPYTWTEKQVTPLLADLYAFYMKFKSSSIDIPVLLGSTILFNTHNAKGSEELQIVDGQQRLTTLAILLFCLNEKKEVRFLENDFPHQKSIDNIKVNQKTINDFIQKKEIDKSEWANFILEKVYFIQINAPTLDDAFVFFDSQNNRGKSLADYDVLKAHHLRYIGSNDLATACAKDWENIDKQKDKSIGLAYLLDTLLGRGRKWSHSDYNRLQIKEEFKSQRSKITNSRQYIINRYQQPAFFEKWTYLVEQGQNLVFHFSPDFDALIGTKSLICQDKITKFLPFQITQTLEGGELFFWYTQKYYELYNELFDDNNPNTSIFFKALNQKAMQFNYNSGAKYVYNVWIAALLFYHDKFGYNAFDTAATWLFHSLYFLRIDKTRLSELSIHKFIRETFNPFSIIHKAAYHEFIFNDIANKMEGKYKELKNKKEPINGISGAFFTGFYYKKNENNPFFITNQELLPQTIRKELEKINQ